MIDTYTSSFAMRKDSDSKILFFKEFEKEGGLKQYSSIAVGIDGIDGIDVVITNHAKDYKQILKEVKEGDVVYMSEVESTMGNAAKSHPNSTIADGESIAQKFDDVKKEVKCRKGKGKGVEGKGVSRHLKNYITMIPKVTKNYLN